jgi:hypothetical protein
MIGREIAALAADYATLAAVIVAAFQLFLSRQQSLTTFEDEQVQHYRSIAAQLPVEVFLEKSFQRIIWDWLFQHSFNTSICVTNKSSFK